MQHISATKVIYVGGESMTIYYDDILSNMISKARKTELSQKEIDKVNKLYEWIKNDPEAI